MAGKSRSESSEEAKDDIKPPISTSAAAADSPRRRPHLLSALNEDILIEILQRVDIEVIVRAGLVCKEWGKACRNPALWRVLDLDKEKGKDKEKVEDKPEKVEDKPEKVEDKPEDGVKFELMDKEKGKDKEKVEDKLEDSVKFELMCQCAVDRSQGQLIDLRIANHGEANLLGYIADRSKHLRRLKLLDYDIEGPVLIEALQKLPELEDLHLMMMTPLHTEEIEAIGTSCPLLKSFTYNNHWECSDDDPEPYNRAFAVAKTMPNLRHLSLVAEPMKNEGLEAILDGCPHLESLDLRRCSGLDLEGDLGKRLSEGIKDVRLPADSISDIKWTIGEYESTEESESEETDVEYISDIERTIGEYESTEESESEEPDEEYESEETDEV